MKNEKLKNVCNLSDKDRYSYFIRKVTDFEKVWALFKDNGWAMQGSKNISEIIIPFWPEEAFAEICAIDTWMGYKPKAIHLSDFLNKWLPGMLKDNRIASIFYIQNQREGIIVSPEKLKEDIEKELESYE